LSWVPAFLANDRPSVAERTLLRAVNAATRSERSRSCHALRTHTPVFILVDMQAVRRTISLPPAVAARLDREAARRGTSFSALVAELVEREPVPLPLCSDD
jgi:hypothetical protein